MKIRLLAMAVITGLSTPAGAQHVHSGVQADAVERSSQQLRRADQRRKVSVNRRKMMERAGYKKVSSLVNFPSFFPGIGVLYVKPDTLPTGPFLAFDRKDRLVSTIYMIPVADFNNQKKFDLKGLGEKSDHVTLYYNPGHPGVDMPHYHVVVWNVSKKDEARVAK
jgi:hypothetical protein